MTRSRRLSPRRCALADGLDDLAARRDADVGHQQDLFERLRRVDVDLARRAPPARRETDHLVEPIETILQLLRRLLQPLLQLVE